MVLIHAGEPPLTARSDTRLREAVQTVRHSGRSMNIRCPLHEDKQASLSVWKTSDGWVHYMCMANSASCSEAALEAHAGLTLRDRAPEDPVYKHVNGNNGGAGFDAFTARIVCTYPYVDEAGKLLFEVVRFTAPKDFRQRRPDPQRPGQWLWKMEDTRRVLYQLPAVVAAVKARTPIWIVEGEKDVASCEARGLVATCNPGGAGKWKPEYSQTLAGAEITIVADIDEPKNPGELPAGLDHAKKVANSLKAVGVRSWRIVQAAAGKDVTDHFDSGHGVEDFVLLQGGPTRAPSTSNQTPNPDRPERRLTEGGNADHFVTRFAEDVRYVDEANLWFVWDGCRFQRDSLREVNGLAREVVAELYASAAEEKDQAHRRALADHAKRSDSAHAVRAMLDLAKSDRAVACRMDAFDRHTDVLTVENGTIDLCTGELLPAARTHLSTRLASVTYDPKATCPRWDDFLWTVCRERSALVRYIQKAIGYSLTGDQTEQCLFLLYGAGANGKSTFLETLRQMLGDYGHTAKTETVLLSRDERSHTPRPDLLDLRGRRMVTASEVVEGKHFNEALVKSMTGGEELNARALYGSTAITFAPTHKLWLGVNHLPVIRGDDEGIWRRIRVIPFEVTIPVAERDPGLPAALRAEWPGILAWAVQGCLAWRAERMGTPPTEVMRATTMYREESDILADFLAERCVVEPETRATGGALYTNYKAWAVESGLRPVSKNVLAGKLNAKGFAAAKSHGVMVYHGIGVRQESNGNGPESSELFSGVNQ